MIIFFRKGWCLPYKHSYRSNFAYQIAHNLLTSNTITGSHIMPLFSRLIVTVCLFCFVSAVPIEAPQSSPIPIPSSAVHNTTWSTGTNDTASIAISSTRRTATAETALPLATTTPSKCGQQEWDAAKRRMRSLISSDSEQSSWPARLLRAGFHDCYEGKCDGSIAHELERPENIGMEPTIDLIRQSISGTCVTLSDAIKIGLELSMELIGAPELKCPKGTASDATQAGPTGEIPTVSQDAQTILLNFQGKGFTTQEAMAGNFGGHSVGRFGDTPFTPTVSRYGNEFAQFMTNSIRDPTGFNSLPSDRTLLQADASGVVQEFASDRSVLDRAFTKFMLKLCSM